MQQLWDVIWAALVAEAPYMLRLVVASACGGIIGVERSLRQKEAGVRTHVVVALGAALAMVLSKYAFFDVAMIDGIRADASRIASQVVSGVGFLGAGVIFVHGATIRGLTTAAGIWTTAAIGMAIGAGMYPLGVIATLMIVILQTLLHKYLRLEKNTTACLAVVLTDHPKAVECFEKQLETHHIEVQGVELKKCTPGELQCRFTVRSEERLLNRMETLLEENPDIRSLSI